MEEFIYTLPKEIVTSEEQGEIHGDLFFQHEAIIHREFFPPCSTVMQYSIDVTEGKYEEKTCCHYVTIYGKKQNASCFS